MKLGILLRYFGEPATYYPQLTTVTGGLTASVLFFQIIKWQLQLNNSQEWVRITSDEIEKVTGLNQSEQKLARRLLVERSLLKERSVNNNTNLLELWADIDSIEQKLSNDSFIVPQSSDSIKNPSLEVVSDSSTPNQTVKTDKFFGQPRQPIAIQVTPHYQFSGPWQTPEQFEQFQVALLEYYKNQGHPNPSGCVFKIIDSITKGIISPFWEEFISGIPLGSSQKVKRDWEIEPGVPYPAFEEERTQYYIQKGEPLEAAVSRARSDLRNPVLGKDLWEGFLRKCDRIADDAIKAKQLGVQNPYLPPSFTEKPQVTKESVMNKLQAISSPHSFIEPSNYSPRETPKNNKLQDLQKETIQEVTAEEKLENQTPELLNSSDSCNSFKIPSLASLQSAYKTPMGRSLVEKQIEEHPEWEYEIINGKIIKSIPF